MKNSVRQFITVYVMVFIGTMAGYSQTQYNAIPEETSLVWIGEKVTGEHTGYINLKSGKLAMENNVIKSGSFMIDMESIVCTDIKNEDKREKLENHLKSKDFFLVKEYPEAYLEIEESGSFEKGSAEIKAKLTIRGNTNPITFRATRQLLDDGLKFFANIIVDRTKYDVKYASGKFFDNLVDKTIYDDFILKVNLMVREE